MTLKDKVQAFRNSARNILRMKAIADQMACRFDDRKLKAETEADIEETKLNLAVANYDLAKLDADHPRFDDKKKYLDEAIARYNAILADLAECLVKRNEVLDAIDEKIAKIESGEIKMDIDKVDAMVKEMIASLPVATALGLKEELDAEDK